MEAPYLTIKEVAQFLHKSEKWVYLNQREIPGYFRLAGSIFFDREVLFTALKSKATKAKK
jgi:predicted DNA-binding transcriptional regulator AlpA